MKKIQIVLFTVLLSTSYISIIDFNSVDAAKTGSYNFCTQFPAYPECVGWRTKALTDNYWFCDYVYLKDLCNNIPEPEKRIPLRTQDYCCKYIGPELQKIKIEDTRSTTPDDNILPTNIVESILPLIVWTDKDHYNYRDKVIVYGKFDFTNPTIIKNINEINFAQTGEISEKKFIVDIKLNGREILRNIPINSNGWFSAFFFHDNAYRFSTQNNLLEVDYIITSGDTPLGGPKTHATYHFTTGDIAQKDDSFDIWVDDSSLPNKIQYGIIVKNPERFIELNRYDLVNTRLTTPDGYVIPIKSVFSIQDLSAEYSGFSEYGQGTYEIQITYGNNTSKKTFEYINSN